MTFTINNLSENSGENAVLKNISLTIESGEILGIFGAGKSALLRAAAADPETVGSVFLSGENASETPSESEFAGSGATENSLNQSSGARQISAFENLLEADANVFLLENPLCFADIAQREEKFSELRKTARRRNASVILATSDFNEIFSICDRAVILNDGAVVQTGTPREIYEHPRSAFVAVATGRINLIEASRLNPDKSDALEFQTASGNHRIFLDRRTTETSADANLNPTLGIRPEHISISFGASFPEDNLVRARISGVKYLGATTLIELDAVGLQLQALVLRLVGLKIGDECMVGLPPNRILIFQ